MKGGMNYGRKSRWQPEKSTYKQQMHPIICFAIYRSCSTFHSPVICGKS
jgi:hypothetical protein